MRVNRRLLSAVVMALCGCYGSVGSLPSELGGTGGSDGQTGGGVEAAGGAQGGGDATGGSAATGGGTTQIQTATCDSASVPADITLDEIAAQFATTVHPVMNTSEASGCTSCHGPEAHRVFTVTANGVETFHLARAANMFRDQPGSLLARLTAAMEDARMPQGQPAWRQTDLDAAARIACMVQTFEARGGTPPDELFPANLLMPYTGPANLDYDNTFINYVQLKAKVKAVFNDTWVRAGVDNFDKNVGLFGGVNFRTNFVEARAATSEFLVGLDSLAPDVCGQAATATSGPFSFVRTWVFRS